MQQVVQVLTSVLETQQKMTPLLQELERLAAEQKGWF
jgi:hypothetical protein